MTMNTGKSSPAKRRHAAAPSNPVDERRLARALNRNEILTDRQVEDTVRLMHDHLGEGFLALAGKLSFDFGESVRLHPLHARVVAAREARGLTIKQVAAELCVPQYRLRAVEEGTSRTIDPVVALAYVGFLGLARWARRWATANPELAEEIGLMPRTKGASRKR